MPFERAPWNIIIIGMGRVGIGAYDWFHERFGDVVLGLDFDRETVARQMEEGRNTSQGDVTDPDFWPRLPAPDGTLKLVVLALANLDAMLFAVNMLKQIGYTGNVAAVARYDDEVVELKKAGVDTAFNVYSKAGAGLAAYVVDSLETFSKEIET